MHATSPKMVEPERPVTTSNGIEKKLDPEEGSLMKIYNQALALVAVASVLSIPVLAQTQGDQPAQDTLVSADHLGGSHEAMQMVPVNAILSRTVDAKNDRPDSTVEARIRNKVTLSDGTVLPTGAMMIGKVAEDDAQAAAGKFKLALRFDQARLKDGTVVPIKATIVGYYAPGSSVSDDTVNADNDVPNTPNTWSQETLGIDQLSVTSGVDLHSTIANDNSGVFVSNKHDIRLNAGSELQFAIGPAPKAS
jgi:hypothetical protein